MRLFVLLLRTNARLVTLAVVVSLVSGAANPLVIALMHRVWTYGTFTDPAWIAAFLAVLAVLITSGYLAQVMVLNLALTAIADLRMKLSAKIMATPLAHLERLGFGKLLAVLADDVSAVSRVLPTIPRVIIDVTTIFGGVAYMVWLSGQALLVLSLFAVFGLVVFKLLSGRAMIYLTRGRQVYDSLFEDFRGLHDGIKQLKLNGARRHAFLFKDLMGSLQDYRNLNLKGRSLLIVAENVTRLLFFLLLGAMMFAVPRITSVDREILSGYVFMALYLYRPMNSLMGMVQDYTRAAVSLKKIQDVGLSLDSEDLEPSDETPPPVEQPLWQRLELRGATYSHGDGDDDSAFRLGPIDLAFERGELVFVLGGNGSGKTTLAKLLTSLYPPESGQVLLDGVEITDANRQRYRELFSVVFTDSHLFSRLVADDPEGLDERATEYLRRLQLAEKVSVEGARFSTTKLSTGQRKRLLLVNAFLEDRPFYVLDEWAADQDPHFKRTFYTEVLPELKARGKTVVVITHDDRYTYIADRCLKLEDGQLVDEPALRTS